jgi:phosphoserine phosphatase
MTDAEPLASWNDGAAKSAILDLVARVTKEGGPDFVPAPERFAVFDNDGTLSCEQPLQIQFHFAFDRVRELAGKDPALAERPTFKAVIDNDLNTLFGLGKQALLELAFATHAGMTDEDFLEVARGWLATAKHPKFGRLFRECVYRPQVELLAYLRLNGFKTYIVSAGGADFMRAFVDEALGVPREQVIGSSVKLRYDGGGARVSLTKLPELNIFNDREAKPLNIGLHIGRRPLLAFGNSDGDLPMMRYVKSGAGPRLALLLRHDDKEREAVYDREFRISPLSEALDKANDYGLTIVSMKRDWRVVF